MSVKVVSIVRRHVTIEEVVHITEGVSTVTR